MSIKFHAALAATALLHAGALSAQSATPAEAPASLDKIVVSVEAPGPGMWKVAKGDNVLWLLGTQSPVLKNMRWKTKRVDAVVATAQEILAPPTTSVSAKQLGYFTTLTLLPGAMQLKFNPKNGALKDQVPPELYARWVVLRDKYIDDTNTNNEEPAVERWRPLFAALELYRSAIDKSGLSSANPVMPRVRTGAATHKVKITDVVLVPKIDDPRGALSEFNSSRLADADCFEKTVARIETELTAMRSRANAWARGNIEALRNLPAADQRAACEAAVTNAAFVKTRGLEKLPAQLEAIWMTAAEKALATNKVTLAVLPITTLLARNGYIDKLRAKGYVVTEPGDDD